jgi:rhamnose transport system permease protein
MNRLKHLLRPEQIREMSLLLIIAVVVLIFGSQIEGYYSGRTFNRISASVAIITVVAVGQTLVVITRNIDLSVGSIVGFTAYFVGQMLTDNRELSPLVAVALAVGVGGLMGLLNGVLVAYGKIPAIIVTLGTMALYRGALVEYSGAQTILVSNMPAWLDALPRQTILALGEIEMRALPMIALVVVIVFQLGLRYLTFGRRLYAIGSNPEAAEMVGLPTHRIVLITFVLCGALAGLGGFMYLARFGTITVNAAVGLELQAVAAVVVGGVNIFGGAGSLIGAMLGSILIGTLEQSLIRTRISEFWKDALLGLLILMSVASDSVILNRIKGLWERSERRRASRQKSDRPERGKPGVAQS